MIYDSVYDFIFHFVFGFVVSAFCVNRFTSIGTTAFLIAGYALLIADVFKLYKISTNILTLFYRLFRIVGVLLIIGGVFLIADFNVRKGGAEKAVGEITQIRHDYNILRERKQYEAFVNYIVDGIEYEGLMYYDLKPWNKIGDSITIYYKHSNMRVIHSSRNYEAGLIILYGMAFILGFVLLSYRKRKRANNESDDTPQSDYDKAMSMLSGRK